MTLAFRPLFLGLAAVLGIAGAVYVGLALRHWGEGAESGVLVGLGLACLVAGGLLWRWAWRARREL